MISRRLRNSLLALSLFIVVAPSLTLAAGGLVPIVPDTCNQPGGCKSVCDLAELAQNILNDGIYIAVFLSAVLFAWAGLKYLTNIANPGEVSRAKEIFRNVVIGLVIILVAWLLVDTVMKTLTGGKIGPWNRVCQAPSGQGGAGIGPGGGGAFGP